MKILRIILLFISIATLIGSARSYAQWKNISAGKIPNITSPNKFSGKILKYKNGALYFAFDSAFWVSTDAGTSWVDITPDPDGSLSGSVGKFINDVDFYDKYTGVLCDGRGIFTTIDGGKTWRLNTDKRAISAAIQFLDSPQLIIATWLVNRLLLTSDGGFTWNFLDIPYDLGFQPGGITDIQVRNGKEILVLNGDRRRNATIYRTSDLGLTWSISTAAFEQDCYSFSIDSCDNNLIAILNEQTLIGGGGPAGILLSTDLGFSWKLTHPTVDRTYFCGSIETAPGGILFAQTSREGIIRSTDKGEHWISIGGPNGPIPDSRLLAVVSADTIYAVDSFANVWMTTDGGGSPVASVPSSLFDADSMFCGESISRSISLRRANCFLPSLKAWEVAGKDSLNYFAELFNNDSLKIIFTPQQGGASTGLLIITYGTDNYDTILLRGYSIPTAPVVLLTNDQRTDTIGGSIRVPISVNGLKTPEDIEIVMHYSDQLVYQGTFSPSNGALDLPGEEWRGRTKLQVAQASSPQVLGYAYFDLFDDLGKKVEVTFDSLVILKAASPCKYDLSLSTTSTISLLPGCGIKTISQYLLSGTFANFTITPNPSHGEVEITSMLDLGETTISSFDILGNLRDVYTTMLKKDVPSKVILPTEDGLYHLQIVTSNGTYHLRAIVVR